MRSCTANRLVLTCLLAGSALIMGWSRVRAQSFVTLYNFSGGTDGAQPFAGLVLSSNILYGTTLLGGSSGDGVIFGLNADGTGFQTLYGFNGFDSGFYAQGTLALSNGVLYGTTHWGGPANNGTVFGVNIDGTVYTVLHSFSSSSGSPPDQTNSDGANPQAGLLLSGETLYGTAVYGGSAGYGTVFAINIDGTAFKVLHNFTTPSSPAQTNGDGANPYGGLVLLGSTLYGTAHSGGGAGRGTVFAINTDGSGFKTLHSFSGTNDGGAPLAGLVLSSNMVYGTTLQGGTLGQGTVFTLKTDGTEFVVQHSFSGSADGANPAADLILAGNTLYGTANYGGSFNNGTVFTLRTDGTGFTNLYSFSAISGSSATNSDGANPYSRLTLSGRTLYGTAKGGGGWGQGTVFSLSLGASIPPVLSISPAGGNVILTWPLSASGFTLESTTNLAPATWSSVTPGPVVINGRNTVTNPISGRWRFYRLSQ
jgi:uncharacterized repeat protein (TIGR03803 family)